MVNIINSFTLLLAAAAVMVSSAPTPSSNLRGVGKSAAADGPDGNFIVKQQEFAKMEMKKAEEQYKLAKALYKQRMDASKNDGEVQFTQFSEVS